MHMTAAEGTHSHSKSGGLNGSYSKSGSLNGSYSKSGSLNGRPANGHHAKSNDKPTNGNATEDKHSAPNPFCYELRANWIDRIIFFLMLVSVAPIRLLLVITSLVFAWFFATLATFGQPIVCERPLRSWRKFFKNVVVVFVRTAWFCAGVHWVSIKGTRVSSKVAPLLVMAPHSSHIDTLAGAKCGLSGVVSVIENARIPIIGSLFRVNESIYLSRGDSDSRQQTVKEILRRAHSAETGGDVWPQLIVFPEGTCTNRSCLMPFKLGAFMAGVPVQPVCIRYPNRLDVVSWINVGPGLLAMFFLLLCYPHTTMEMEYLPVYYPSEEEKRDARLFAENVRQLFSKHLEVPLTHHTYEDLIKLQQSSRPDRSFLCAFKSLLLDGVIRMPTATDKEE